MEKTGGITFTPGRRLHTLFGGRPATEGYRCSYGPNPKWRGCLEATGWRFTGFGETGKVRAGELPSHPFFIGTLFQPERSALRGERHPLITALSRRRPSIRASDLPFMPVIRLAETDADIARCFPVMVQLRIHLSAGGFVTRVRRMQTEGYALALLKDDAKAVRAVGGFRIRDMLAHGRTMYVDDLVTDAGSRSLGHGRRLFDWPVARARAEGCHEFSLDSGTHRHDAHRFYFRQRMHISSRHFPSSSRNRRSEFRVFRQDSIVQRRMH